MDVHSPEIRKYNMSQIKGQNTKPEVLVRKTLWKLGYRYRLHRKDLPGKPDIVFSSRRKVIFVHGCFWHRHECEYFRWPATREAFWRQKIEGNAARDMRTQRRLKDIGWDYLIIWECEIKKKPLKDIVQKAIRFLK